MTWWQFKFFLRYGYDEYKRIKAEAELITEEEEMRLNAKQ